ncbi:MAG: hypothetical protein HY701_11210 [Gemmatimonadetes bacterium]|nr:hypothetical protein [Gemmatimonadota bacterium]
MSKGSPGKRYLCACAGASSTGLFVPVLEEILDSMSRPRVLPPVYFLLSIILMIVLHALVPVARIVPEP